MADGPAGRRRDRLRAALGAHGIDILIATEPATVRYATGIAADVLWSSHTRTIALVLPREGEPVVVAPGFIAGEVRTETGLRVEPWDALDAPAALLAALAADAAGPGTAPVAGLELGVEARPGLTPRDLATLTAALGAARPGMRTADAMPAIWAARMVKEADELERIGWACAASSAGIATGFGVPRGGMTEREVARTILAGGLAASAAWPAWTVPGWIGMTSGAGHYDRFVERPRDRRLAAGDLLWTDVGFRADGYWSDFCRAAVVGGPTTRQADRQRRILAATAAGVAAARTGVRASDVARAVMAEMERQGLPSLGFGRLGHGIGLTATEPPSIALHDATVLAAGMVVTVEPAAVMDDGLYCAEQVVVVGEEPRVLSLAPGELATI